MSKVRVNYKSDLPPIEITFKVNNVAVDVPDHDFVLRFFVDGCNESYYCGCRYVESEDGEGLVPEYSRCSPSSGGSKLTCYINNHKFTPGRLHVEMIDLAANESYADGVKKTVVPDDLDVYLIDGVGDEVDNVVTDTFNYCVGRGILSVTKQGTVGVVDTYTITFDDGTTTTFRVTNGRDGVVLDGDPATLIADDLVTSDSAKILSAKQGVVLRGSEVFLIPDDYAYNVSNFIPFLSIEAIGDIDALKSMSIYDTTAYTDAETDNTTLALFNLTINSSSTQIAIRKSDVSSSLGVQRIVKECIRWNLIFVFVVDFDLLEEYNGVARTNVNMKALKRNYNPFITKRQNIFGGYIEADAADTYTIGTRVCARLSDGENVFTYFKTRQDVVSNYNAARAALSINSYGDSVVELLKVDTNDWVMLRKVCQMKKGSVTCSQSNVAGAYTGGIKGNETLGLTSSTNAFTIAIKFKTPESWPLTSRWLFYNTVLSLALYHGRHSLLLQSGGTTLIESRTLELDTEYDAVITFDNGSVTLRINGVESSASDKSLTGTEGTPWVGSAQSSGVPDGVYVGIIRSLKIYDAVISNEDEIDAEYSTNANLLLNLQPQSVMDNVWLDMSDEMRYFTPRVQDSRIAVVYDNTGEASAMTHSLERVNLFNPKTYDFNDWKSLSFGSGVLTEAVLDTSSGAIGSWTVAARDQFSAVAVIPVSVGKYYCIINPYSTMTPSRVGVISLSRKVKWLKDDTIRWNYGNPNADNIYMAGTKYVVAQATFTGNNSDTVNAFVDAITVPLYRVQSTVPYPIETPMVEVYEMDSASEAIEYINCRIGEDKAIGESVNLDNKILDSDHVGTLSSMMSGTSMLVMGDSITANHGWTNYVANKLKWKGISNIAIGGANICASYNVTSGTQRNLIYQMRNIANFLGDVCYAEGELVDYTEGGSTVQRYTKTFDTVFISMGYNDASNGWTCGSLADVEDVAWSSLAPANDDTRFSSIAAAIKYCLFYLKTTVITGTITVNGSSVNIAADCRKARFIWQTPIGTAAKYGNDTTGATTDARLRAVEDVIAEVCNHYSVQVVNGRLLCGITREEENLYEGGKYLGDKTHPNADGYIKLGEMNLKAILGGFGYDSAVNDKQDTLVSGTNIKTVNNQTLLGSGNITIQGGGGGGVQSDWDVTDVTSMAYIKNKPTIPAAQVQSDWNEANSSSKAYIQNKPTIPTVPTNISAFNNDAGYLTQHQSIKTVNNISLVGSGNVSTETPVVEVSGATVTQTLSPNTFYLFGSVTSLTVTLGSAVSGIANIYAFRFTAGQDNPTITLPQDVVINKDLSLSAGDVCEFSIMDNKALFSVWSAS